MSDQSTQKATTTPKSDAAVSHSATAKPEQQKGGKNFADELKNALENLGFSILDDAVLARFDALISKRANERAEQAREREFTKVRWDQLEPKALVKLLPEALLPQQKRRGPKPGPQGAGAQGTGAKGADVRAGADSSGAPADSTESAKQGVSGVPNV